MSLASLSAALVLYCIITHSLHSWSAALGMSKRKGSLWSAPQHRHPPPEGLVGFESNNRSGSPGSQGSITGSNIATGRQRSIQFILRKALVSDDEGRILRTADSVSLIRSRCQSSKNSKANRIEIGERSGGIRRNLFGGSRRKIAKKTSMARMVATKALLLHAWRGASDSGGPPGERNGQY